MDVQLVWRRRARALLVALVGAGVVACAEDLEGGAACPVLCPGQAVIVQDTTFDAVALDTSLVGFPALGLDPSLPLIWRADTVDVRAVVRFDSLPSTFVKNGGDSTITAVDSAYVVFAVRDTTTVVRGQVRIDVYDVDTTAADSSLAAIRALFRADRLMGGTTFDSAQVKDSVKVFLNNGRLLQKIAGKQRLRLGFRATSVTGGRPVTVDLGSVDGGRSPFLRFDPAPADTAIHAVTVNPLSKTPPNQPALALDFTDYSVVFAAPPPPSDGTLSVGGLPARRSYLRFDIPSRILDSATVLRATLILTQKPNRSVLARDSVTIVPQLVTAGTVLTDLYRSSILISAFAFDSLRAAPGDSGSRSLEIATAVRQWNGTNVFQTQRAIVLRSTDEGVRPNELQFYSTEDAPSLRPRLRINYALRSSFGIP